MASFLYLIIDGLLQLLAFAIVATAIVSWLVAFDVINLRNRTAYSIVQFLDAVTRPVLRPFQRFIPTLGGVDVSPIVALIVIWAFRATLLRMARDALAPLIG